VKIKEEPEGGRVNKKVLKLLSAYFGVSESEIRLVRGFKKRNKIFEIK